MKSDWQLYKRLLSYMYPYVGALFVSVLGNVLYAAMQVLTADTMQFVVDSFGVGSDKLNSNVANGLVSRFIYDVLQPLLDTNFGAMFWIPCVIIVVIFIRGIGSFLGAYYIDVVGRGTIHHIRCALFDHLLLMPISYFDKNNAYLINRITFNVQQVAQAVTRALTITVREGMTVIGMLIYMLYLNWLLTLMFLLVVPFIALVIRYVSRRFRRLSSRIQNSMGDVTHVTSETVSGIRTVKIFSGEEYEMQRFVDVSNNNQDQTLKMSLTDAIASPVIQLLIAAALAVLVAYGLSPYFSTEVSSGVFVALLTAAGLIAKPLKQLGEVLSIIQKGLAAAADIFDQLDSPIEINNRHFKIARAQGELRINNLSFSYHEAQSANLHEFDVLKNINLHIQAGQTVAFVGRSGSGKSTLVNLLPRFYVYKRGSIELDGVDINEFELNNLRQQFALVSQHITLFNDTVYNNIAYGALRHVKPEEVQEAMRIAYVTEFVDKLPHGVHTIIGDQGVLLSGGQRQRIAIARAILKNAPILILDEATSALDNDSERFIQQALEKAMQGRTNIVIAHRLSTVENADQILVMEQGCIIEQGTHRTLLEKNGVYADLYNN